jgi:SAM-dependent methyltransferase
MPLMDALKAGTPWPLRRMIRRFKTRIEHVVQPPQSPQSVFTKVYAERRWHTASRAPKPGARAFYSGPGSDNNAAAPYADCVNDFIRRHRVLSVVDLGCGDFRIGRRIANQPIHYVGVDVVEPLIHANRRRFVADNVQFRCLDIITDALPHGELCLLREVLQHLSNDQILAILPKLRKFKWVIVTEVQLPVAEAAISNRDKPHGAHTRVLWDSFVDLGAHPFYVQNMERLLSVPAPRTDDPRPVFSNSFLIRNIGS